MKRPFRQGAAANLVSQISLVACSSLIHVGASALGFCETSSLSGFRVQDFSCAIMGKLDEPVVLFGYAVYNGIFKAKEKIESKFMASLGFLFS